MPVSLALILLLTLTVAALPHVVVNTVPVSHPLLRRLSTGASFKHIADIDRARAKALKSRGSASHTLVERAVFPDPVFDNPLGAFVIVR